jgi:DNA-binding protein HU-beta
MRKDELVTFIAEMTGITKRDVSSVIDAFETTVANTVGAGEEVILKGFGSFKLNVRSARTGRNPASGEAIDIPESSYPTFKTGTTFKREVTLAVLARKEADQAAKKKKKKEKDVEPVVEKKKAKKK